MVQQVAPLEEGKKPDVQELHTPEALQVAQLVIVQAKQELPAALGRNPVAQEVQTLLVAQV